MVTANQLLMSYSRGAERQQVTDAIERFGLDASRTEDVLAARAYVWATSDRLGGAGAISSAPFSGPGNDAAAQAIMRFELVNPGTLYFATNGNSRAQVYLTFAAESGFADYLVESRARPPGVAPQLQTTSRSARAAIASQLPSGNIQVHHLVAANVWGANISISQLAFQAGWRVDAPSNLMALPADARTQATLGGSLPIHNGSHPTYDRQTDAQIAAARTALGNRPITPLLARAILDSVALGNRMHIIAGAWNPRVN